jgi:hypothetical protein
VTQLNGDLAAELVRLKAEPGKDLLIQGGTVLVRLPLRGGLLDELSLLIIPILAGVGPRLFDDNARVELTLTDSTVFDNGVVKVSYRPASAPDGDADEVADPDPEQRAVPRGLADADEAERIEFGRSHLRLTEELLASGELVASEALVDQSLATRVGARRPDGDI